MTALSVVASEQDTNLNQLRILFTRYYERRRTFIAMMGIKLNAQVCTQVIINNLQNMHEKSLPPTGART